MKTKLILGTLFLGLVAQATQGASAQDASSPAEAIASPSDLSQDGYFAFDENGDKTDCAASCCSPCPRVYGYVEALFLERTNCSDDQPIIVNLRRPDGSVVSPSEGTPVFSTSDLDFDFEPAVRAVVGHRLHNGWAVEGAYLGLFDADTSAFVSALPDQSSILTFPGDLAYVENLNVIADMDKIWVDYSSSLHSGELNLVCCCGCCDPCGKGKDAGNHCNLYCRTFEWFMGFRYINFREELNIHGQAIRETGVEDGYYNVQTSNNLYGAQVGARTRRWGTKWGWEATGKAGIFANDAQQEQVILDWDNEPFTYRSISAAETPVAFVGELNLTGIYRLNDVWNLRAGYNLIWITGVALAPDQLDFSTTPTAGSQINSSGGVLLHGVSCGLEARW
jgi:hypothetical protein